MYMENWKYMLYNNYPTHVKRKRFYKLKRFDSIFVLVVRFLYRTCSVYNKHVTQFVDFE